MIKNKKILFLGIGLLVAIIIVFFIFLSGDKVTLPNSLDPSIAPEQDTEMIDRGNYVPVQNPVTPSTRSVVERELTLDEEKDSDAIRVYNDFYDDPAFASYREFVGIKLPSTLSISNKAGEILNLGAANKPIVLAFTTKDDSFFSDSQNKFSDFEKLSKEFDNYIFAVVNLEDDENEEFTTKFPTGYIFESPDKDTISFFNQIRKPCILYIKNNEVQLASYPSVATSVSSIALSLFKSDKSGEDILEAFDAATKEIQDASLIGLANPRVPTTLTGAEDSIGFKPVVPKAFKNGDISLISGKVLNIDADNMTFRTSQYSDIDGDYTIYTQVDFVDLKDFMVELKGDGEDSYSLIKWGTVDYVSVILLDTPVTKEAAIKLVN